MPAVELHERSFQFALSVLQYVRQFPRRYHDEVIGRQLIRSATSIGANLMEAKGGASRKEFLQFLRIARRSSYETEYWLRLSKAMNLGTLSVDRLLDDVRQLSRILTSIIIKVDRHRELLPRNQ